MRHAARVLLGLVLVGGVAGARAEAPLGARLEYHAWFAGLRVVRADTTLHIADGRYRMTFDGGSEGLLDLLWSWRSSAATEGSVADGRLRPDEHRFERLRGERSRTVTLRYGRDGQPRLEDSGPPGRSDDQRVPPEMQAGTVDYLSLIGTLVSRVSAGAGCGHDAALFNGWRRFDIELRPVEDGDGAAPACRFVAVRRLPSDAVPERRANRVPGWSTEAETASVDAEADEPVSGTIRFASAWAGGPMVPAQIDVDGWFGAASVQLAAACPLRAVPDAAVSAARAAPPAVRQSCG